MADEDEVLVTRADIARLAEVHRPAVANWERRHEGFPPAVGSIDGVERFRAADVIAWLESRRIPRNSRSADETEGSTFADRFRRNLGIRPEGGPDDRTQQRLVDKLSDPGRVDLFRGALSVGQYRDLILALIYVKGCRPREWSMVKDAVERPNGAFLGIVHKILSGTDLHSITALFGPAMPALRHEEGLRELVRLVDAADPQYSIAGPRKTLQSIFICLLQRFAEHEGKRSAELLTPPSITKLVGRLLSETGGGKQLYDPFCRTGEFLAELVAESIRSGSDPSTTRAIGLHPSPTSCRLAEMNLALQRVELDVRVGLALSRPAFQGGRHDLVACNPPFNMRLDEQAVRSSPWRYGEPPPHNANFAWLQHVASSLNDRGRAAVVVANNACFSANLRERKIRAAMVEDGIVACVIALPAQLFAGTGVPASLWVLDNQRRHSGEILFIDATTLGTRSSRTSRILTEDDISEVIAAFRQWWRSLPGQRFDKARARRVAVSEVRDRDYSLNPASYVDPPAPTVTAHARLRQVEDLTGELRVLHGMAKEADVRAASPLTWPVAAGDSYRDLLEKRPLRGLIGQIPGGWRETPLRQLAEIQAGPSGKGLTLESGATSGVPIVLPRDLRDGWISEDTSQRVTSAPDSLLDHYSLEAGDIVCTRTGELGRQALVAPAQRGWLFATGLLRVRTRGGIIPDYLSCYLGLPQVRDWIRRHATGTAVPSIQARVLGELPIVLPPLDIQHEIGKALQLMQDEVRIHDQISRTAIRLRETLAPLLMTGVLPPS